MSARAMRFWVLLICLIASAALIVIGWRYIVYFTTCAMPTMRCAS